MSASRIFHEFCGNPGQIPDEIGSGRWRIRGVNGCVLDPRRNHHKSPGQGSRTRMSRLVGDRLVTRATRSGRPRPRVRPSRSPHCEGGCLGWRSRRGEAVPWARRSPGRSWRATCSATQGPSQARREAGIESEYGQLLDESKQRVEAGGAGPGPGPLPGCTRREGTVVGRLLLMHGLALILDAVVENELLSIRVDALKRVPGPSDLGGFHYIPILFGEGGKARQSQKRVLEICGLVLGEIQGRRPGKGILVDPEESSFAGVRLEADTRATRTLLARVAGDAGCGLAARADPQQSLPRLRVPATLPGPGVGHRSSQPAAGHRGEGDRQAGPSGHLQRHPALVHLPAPQVREELADRSGATPSPCRPWRSARRRSISWAIPSCRIARCGSTSTSRAARNEAPPT